MTVENPSKVPGTVQSICSARLSSVSIVGGHFAERIILMSRLAFTGSVRQTTNSPLRGAITQ